MADPPNVRTRPGVPMLAALVVVAALLSVDMLPAVSSRSIPVDRPPHTEADPSAAALCGIRRGGEQVVDGGGRASGGVPLQCMGQRAS